MNEDIDETIPSSVPCNTMLYVVLNTEMDKMLAFTVSSQPLAEQ